MVPLWKRSKNEIEQEEYDDFYMRKFNDYTKPLKTIHTRVEGNVSYDAILYIPTHIPTKGKVIDSRLPIPENAPSSIDVTLSGITSSVTDSLLR